MVILVFLLPRNQEKLSQHNASIKAREARSNARASLSPSSGTKITREIQDAVGDIHDLMAERKLSLRDAFELCKKTR